MQRTEDFNTEDFIDKIFFEGLIFLICLSIIFAGIVSNDVVQKSNGNKMPVFSPYKFETTTHFTYEDNEEVNYYLLSDRINLFNYIWSIGDFLLIFGGILFSIKLINLGRIYSQWMKIKKSKKK